MDYLLALLIDNWRALLILCPLVFTAGLIDSIAGGGGLISLPAYMIVGLPPHMALGSNKFSSTFGTFVANIRYFKNKRVELKSGLLSVPAALLGSTIGSRVVLLVSDEILRYLMLFVVPIVAIFILINKNFGLDNRFDELKMSYVAIISISAGLVIGFYDGFFGPGTGSFLILVFALLLKLDLVTASGNAKLVNLATNIAALVTFIRFSQVAFALAIPAAICGIAGNYVGSGLAIKKGAKFIRPIFVLALVLLLGFLAIDIISG